MKQFFKNLGAMLYMMFALSIAGSLIIMIFGFISSLSIVWMIIIGFLFGFIILMLSSVFVGAAISPAIKWIDGTKTGKIMGTIAIVVSYVYFIFSVIDAVLQFNMLNSTGQGKYLLFQIIAAISFTISMIFATKLMWDGSSD